MSSQNGEGRFKRKPHLYVGPGIRLVGSEPEVIPLGKKIPVGRRTLTFDEMLKGHERLLRHGIDKYGSRKVDYDENMRHAQLALWNTLLSGVSYNKFRAKFLKEMRIAVRNDNTGKHRFEWHAVRLDNPNVNLHDLIPDRRNSLNLDLMAKRFGRKAKARIVEKIDPRIARRESRRRRRELKRAEWAFGAERREELKQERIEASRLFQDMLWGHMVSIREESIEKPFLLKPSLVIAVLDNMAKVGSVILRIRPGQKEIRAMRLLMGRIKPVDPEQVGQFKPEPVEQGEYMRIREDIIAILEHYDRSDYVSRYLLNLLEVVGNHMSIPMEIATDLKLVRRGQEKEKQDAEAEYARLFSRAAAQKDMMAGVNAEYVADGLEV